MLPCHRGDFVLLTPTEILTRDEAWINQGDMLDQFSHICPAIPDESLRAQVNEHFYSQITQRTTEKERRVAALRTIEKFHELLDYYIQRQEELAPKLTGRAIRRFGRLRSSSSPISSYWLTSILRAPISMRAEGLTQKASNEFIT